MYIIQKWIDPRLAFHKTDGITSLDIRPRNIHRIWRPDTYLSNAKSSTLKKSATADNVNMKISFDGEVLYLSE